MVLQSSPSGVSLRGTFVHKTETGDRRIDPVEFVRWCRACGKDPTRCIVVFGDRKRP